MYRSRPPFWLLACLALFLATDGTASSSSSTTRFELGTPMNWLTAINIRRAEAGLPPLVEDPSLSEGARLHSRYLVKTGSQEFREAHSENPRSPWYTAKGDAAARIGNVMSSIYWEATDQFAVDSWTQGPFHLLAYLNPTLSAVGFGSYREDGGRVQMAAALPLSPGRRLPKSAVGSLYPIVWPGRGKTIDPPLAQYLPSRYGMLHERDTKPAHELRLWPAGGTPDRHAAGTWHGHAEDRHLPHFDRRHGCGALRHRRDVLHQPRRPAAGVDARALEGTERPGVGPEEPATPRSRVHGSCRSKRLDVQLDVQYRRCGHSEPCSQSVKRPTSHLRSLE